MKIHMPVSGQVNFKENLPAQIQIQIWTGLGFSGFGSHLQTIFFLFDNSH
jgi:predicted oxidoreductase (fatty acid repression mutant protein)